MLCTKANFTSSSARSFRVNRRKKFKPSRKTLKLAFIYRTHRAVIAYAFDCEQSPSRVMLFEDTSSDLMFKINRRRASSDWCNEMHNNDRRRADNRQWQAIVNCSVWEMNEQINLNAKRSLISADINKIQLFKSTTSQGKKVDQLKCDGNRKPPSTNGDRSMLALALIAPRDFFTIIMTTIDRTSMELRRCWCVTFKPKTIVGSCTKPQEIDEERITKRRGNGVL